MFDEVKERLAAVSELTGRIQPGASLSELMARNMAPQACPAAFILPLGIRGGSVTAMSGFFAQDMIETLGIILFLRSAGDVTGGKMADQLTPLRNEVIRAIAGWSPQSDWLEDDTVGVFRLERGQLVSLSGGLLIYQIEFGLEDQLRI